MRGKETESAFEALEAMTQLIDMTVGYRAHALAAGFMPETAEQMALDFHHAVMGSILNAGP